MKKKELFKYCIATIILLYTYTATSKLLNYDKFIIQLKLSPLSLVKILAAPLLGWSVLAIEIFIVMLLLIQKGRLYGLYTSIVLLSVFVIYITALLISGFDLPCTCGGVISRMSWKEHIVFNGIFILINGTAIVLEKQQGDRAL